MNAMTGREIWQTCCSLTNRSLPVSQHAWCHWEGGAMDWLPARVIETILWWDHNSHDSTIITRSYYCIFTWTVCTHGSAQTQLQTWLSFWSCLDTCKVSNISHYSRCLQDNMMTHTDRLILPFCHDDTQGENHREDLTSHNNHEPISNLTVLLKVLQGEWWTEGAPEG